MGKELDLLDFYPKLGQNEFADTRINESKLVKEKLDPINPQHYNSTNISAFDVIDDWGLNFYTGNVVKYIQRAGKKENNSELQDLKKAQRYLEKQIELLEVGKML